MFFLLGYCFRYFDLMKSNVLPLRNEISRHFGYQYSEVGCFLAFIASHREEFNKSDALRNFVTFLQFKKREKHPWRSVTFSKVAG